MSTKQKIYFALLKAICLFVGGFCMGRFFNGDYFLSAIGGMVAVVTILIYMVSWDYIIEKLKDEYEMYKDIAEAAVRSKISLWEDSVDA